jgi:hypothetical protein
MFKIYQVITSVLSYVITQAPAVLAADCGAKGDGKDCYGLDTSAVDTGLNMVGPEVPVLAGQYIGRALSFLGVIFFGLVLWGGFLWMTARGDGKKVEEGKDIIIRATIGLIIIFSAYAITAFVGGIAQNPGS